jgi:phage replication O-like protein O
MANPSIKNGHLDIANELVERLATINIPGQQMRIIWVVWRYTWCWKKGDRKKDFDRVPLSVFDKMTNMKRSNVTRSLKALVAKRLLSKTKKGYGFNQNYDQWVVAKRLPGVAKRLQPSSQKASEVGSQKAPLKRYKDNLKRKNSVVFEQSHKLIVELNHEDKLNDQLLLAKYPSLSDELLKNKIVDIAAWRAEKEKTKVITTNQVLGFLKVVPPPKKVAHRKPKPIQKITNKLYKSLTQKI